MKKQTMNNWIKNKLIENNQDIEKVKALFDLCRKELGTKGSKQNYYRRIRETIQEMKKEGMKFTSPIDYSKWNREELIELLTQEILRLEKKLSIEDIKKLSEKNKIPYGAFVYYLPDIRDVIKQVYSHNLIQLKDDIDSQKLKEKIKLLTKENNHLKSLQVDYSSLVDVLEDVVQVYEPYSGKPVYITPHKNKREGVALLSDTHFGETVNLEEMHGINEYNPEIAKKRLDQYFIQVIEWAKELGVSVLHIPCLGDMVSGRIHMEILENTSLSTTETILQLADYISNWIRVLSEHFEKISIYGISGNHGRMSLKPSYKQKNKVNFDYLMYEFIKRQTQDIVHKFVLPESFFVVENVLGYGLLFLHGDILSGGGGINGYSLTWGRDLAKLNGLFRQNGLEFNYTCMGHFHSGDMYLPVFDGSHIILNGSLKGADEYAIQKVKNGNSASQQFFVVEENKGVLFNNAIYLD